MKFSPAAILTQSFPGRTYSLRKKKEEVYSLRSYIFVGILNLNP